jgi:hypothetical protein
MEFPYNLVAKTTAKASEVMANFNAIKTTLEGGLTIANFAAGASPILSQIGNYWGGSEKIDFSPAGLTAWDLLPGGASGADFTVPAKCAALMVVSADIQLSAIESHGAELNVVPYIDGVAQSAGLKSALSKTLGSGGFDITRSVFSNAGNVSPIAAGAHKVRLVASFAGTGAVSASIYTAKVNFVFVPLA